MQNVHTLKEIMENADHVHHDEAVPEFVFIQNHSIDAVQLFVTNAVTSPEFSLYQFRGLLPLDGITDPEIIAHAVRDYLDQFLFQKLTGTIPEGLLFQADIRK